MIIAVAFFPTLAGGLILLNWLFAPVALDAEKSSGYECGFLPIEGQTRGSFPVAFYLVGLLFMIFDLEILLVYPFCASMSTMDYGAVAGVVAFLAILGFGLVYEIRSGAINFTES